MIIEVTYDQLKNAKVIFGVKQKIFYVEDEINNNFRVVIAAEGFAFILSFNVTIAEKPSTFATDFPEAILVTAILV